MADVLRFFMAQGDEATFFRGLEPLGFAVYPEISAADDAPVPLRGALAAELTDETYYFAFERDGPPVFYTLKRGPRRGALGIDEVRSEVIHYERSLLADGELRAGQLWVDLSVSTKSGQSKSEAFRQAFVKVRELIHRFRRTQPVGHFVGPGAARAYQMGVKLRGRGHKGVLYRPFR
jgi:hypothetical protein